MSKITDKATAARRRIGQETKAAALREAGWTCVPPEAKLQDVADSADLTNIAKGVYLSLTIGTNEDGYHSTLRHIYGAELAELARAGYMEPLS